MERVRRRRCAPSARGVETTSTPSGFNTRRASATKSLRLRQVLDHLERDDRVELGVAALELLQVADGELDVRRRRTARARSRSLPRSRRHRRRCARPRRETRCRSPRRNRRRARACRRSTAGRTRTASGAARRSPARSRPARCARDGSTIAHNSKVSFDRLAGAPQAHDARAGGPARARATIVTMLLAAGLDPAVARAGRAALRWVALLVLVGARAWLYAARVAGARRGRSRRRSWPRRSSASRLVSALLVGQPAAHARPRRRRSRSCSSSRSRSPVARDAGARRSRASCSARSRSPSAVCSCSSSTTTARSRPRRPCRPRATRGSAAGRTWRRWCFALAAPLAVPLRRSKRGPGRCAWSGRASLALAARARSRSPAPAARSPPPSPGSPCLRAARARAGRARQRRSRARLAATLALSVLPSPASANPTAADRAGPRTRRGRRRAGLRRRELCKARLQDDIGHPGVGVADTTRASAAHRLERPDRGVARRARPRRGPAGRRATASGPRTGRSSTATCSSTRTSPRTRTSGFCCSSASSAFVAFSSWPQLAPRATARAVRGSTRAGAPRSRLRRHRRRRPHARRRPVVRLCTGQRRDARGLGGALLLVALLACPHPVRFRRRTAPARARPQPVLRPRRRGDCASARGALRGAHRRVRHHRRDRDGRRRPSPGRSVE